MSPGLRIRSLIFMALACGASAAGAAEISGTAVFRERTALPPKAVFEATLVDYARMDAPATVLGQVRLTDPPAAPISFRIRFDRANYDARHQYFVRARILVDGQPLFVTDRDYRVLERGVDHSVAVTLIRAPRDRGTPERAFTDLPADFIGTLPCSDCAGIRHTLRLLPGHGFHLATTRLRSGDDVTTWERGTWNQSSDRRMLRLDTGRGRSVSYTIVDRSTLRALDDDGVPVSTRPGNDLRRARSAVPLEPRGRMKGMYRYLTDTGSFVDCATGQRLRVAHEADNAALERAYSEHRPGPGAEVQVTVDGRIAMRPRMEGSGEEAALIVERFVDVRPAERCGTGRVMSSLDATRWVPTWIGERRIRLHAGSREPYLVLEARSRKVTGFGGCNRFNGTFERSGDALRLGPLASTRMACPGGSFDESEFLAALEATRSWRVLGTELTLFDEQGAVAARFEARDL